MSLTKKIHEEVQSAKQKSNKLQSQSQKNLNTRLDNLYLKTLTGTAYDAGVGSHNSNCLYFVQRDSSTIEVYKGDTKISGKGKLSFLHLALLTGVWWDVYLGVKMPITIPEKPSVLEGAELYYGSTTNSRYLYRHQLAIRVSSLNPTTLNGNVALGSHVITYRELHTEVYSRRATGNVYEYKDLELLPDHSVLVSVYKNGTKIRTFGASAPAITRTGTGFTITKRECGMVILSDSFETTTGTYFYQTGRLGIGTIYTYSDGVTLSAARAIYEHGDDSTYSNVSATTNGIFWNAPPDDGSAEASAWSVRDRLKEFYDTYEGLFSQCVAERYNIEEDT